MSNELVEHLKTCRRSHPHENMDEVCARYTYYERELSELRAENEKLKDNLVQQRRLYDMTLLNEERWMQSASSAENRVTQLENDRTQAWDVANSNGDELERLRSINAELIKALHDVCTQYQKVRDADAGYTGIPSRSIDAARAAIERAKQ